MNSTEMCCGLTVVPGAAHGRRTRDLVHLGIDPRGRIGHAATNLTPASTLCAESSRGDPHSVLMDEHLGLMATEFGDKTAFEVVDVGSMTFAEWDGAANAMARRLLDAGLQPGARVGIHLHPELALCWLVSYSAAHRAGGVAVPMNPRLAPAEVAHVLSHSGATAVVADGELVASDLGAGGDGLLVLVDAGTEGTVTAAGQRLRRGPAARLGRSHRGRPLALPGAA